MGYWTCKGKGGRYRLITKVNEDGSPALAKGAGTSKECPDIVVYCDVATEAMYYRTLDDFFCRMRLVLECPDCEARQCIMDNEEQA